MVSENQNEPCDVGQETLDWNMSSHEFKGFNIGNNRYQFICNSIYLHIVLCCVCVCA